MAASVSLAPPIRRNTGVLVAAMIGGVLLLLFGLLCLALYLAWPALETRSARTLVTPDEAISQAAEFAALGVYGLGLGAGLLWQVVRAWRGVPGRRFRPARVAGVLALLLFPVALVLGVAALDLPHRAAGYLFPLPALLAVLTPPVLVISLVAQAGWGRGRVRRGAESPPRRCCPPRRRLPDASAAKIPLPPTWSAGPSGRRPDGACWARWPGAWPAPAPSP